MNFRSIAQFVWGLLFLLLGVRAFAAGIEVTLVIDRSGSMKQTDPDNLRLLGAQQFVDLARDEDTISVWQFADNATVVVPPTLLAGAASRAAVKKGIQSIDHGGLYTDITQALDAVFSSMNAVPKPTVRRYVILMTDGQIDLSGGRPRCNNRAGAYWRWCCRSSAAAGGRSLPLDYLTTWMTSY